MNPNIPSIDQLKELGLPAPVSYAPQTWGWWVLLGLLGIAVVLVSARKVWQWRRDRYRREGLVRLAELQRRSDDLSALRELPELLKRVALSIPSPTWNTNPVGAGLLAKGPLHSTLMSTDPAPSRASPLPQGVGALSGEEWQAFLQLHSPKPLPADFSQQLAQLAYAPDATLLALSDEHRQHLFATCKRWVEHHHVAA
ncbi:DUF4381 domain-containing protein [Pseudomonas frederiksbergensis]|uniref:Alpha-2 type XI collagen n=1 Tax=Pseudomonas frederiksbergensis TaxID=104087 RepID=A0A423KHQ4_9PSED|nr:DUF4381 domain-containing protein [Pseudomonas frederiksbergensis]RON52596.1 alpha-2 type XI collagen [Pseudomonas frederiksbergensis]